ncbi:MAG: hypothetical protein Q7K33_02000 [Candidatus Berkelbacteria bacterium]|nr:hypothetical protein [Candidatus Berkelbacteria bacterium]
MKNLNSSTVFISAFAGFLLALALMYWTAKPDKTGYLADASDRVGKPAPKRTITGNKGEKIVISEEMAAEGNVDFDVNKQVSYGKHYFEKDDLIGTSTYDYQPNGLVRDLLNVPGVVKLDIDVYTISVNIGTAFDSRKVSEKLVAILKEWLKKPAVVYEDEVPKPKERPTPTSRGPGGYPFYGS